MLHNPINKTSEGFSLLEMVVAAAILSAISAWAIPSYFKIIRQGEVDRYAQFIEAGFYNLRAELGTTRTSCQLNFGQAQSWVKPNDLLEFRQDNGVLAKTDRLSCCNSQIEKIKVTDECHDGPLIGSLLNGSALNSSTGGEQGSLRFIRVEGSQESKRVYVAVSRPNYELTPPGTSARTEPITFMVRSLDSEKDNTLRTRCVEISGSGHLLSGTWDGDLKTGQCMTLGQKP